MLHINKEQKLLILLSFAELWERFSYYGMRALLVLYLITQLGFEDSEAYTLYAFFASIGYLGCFGFGYLSDRWFGPKYLVLLGGSTMMVGHLLMAFSFLQQELFFLGLSLIAVGTSAFKGNLTNILGLCYKDLGLSHKQDEAYIFFYSMLNLGGLLAGIICGTIGMKYSWHLGFGIAAFGMALGLITFIYLNKTLLGKIANKTVNKKSKGYLILGVTLYSFIIAIGMIKSSQALEVVQYLGLFFIAYYLYIVYQSPKEEQQNLLILLLLLVFFVIFYALEMQTGALIILFASRNVDLTVGSYEIAAATVDSINPLIVMISGFITYFLLSKRVKTKDTFVQSFAFGLFTIPLSFSILYLGTLLQENNKMSLIYLVLGMSVMALGEIFIGPIIQSKGSDLAPPGKRGLVFGIMMFAASYANVVGNFAAKYMAVEKFDGKMDLAKSLLVYQDGFLMVIKITFIATLAFIVLSPIINKTTKKLPYDTF
jgi:POT family proton-dependent oligopeptide transporter